MQLGNCKSEHWSHMSESCGTHSFRCGGTQTTPADNEAYIKIDFTRSIKQQPKTVESLKVLCNKNAVTPSQA